jgi:hypothetical protein
MAEGIVALEINPALRGEIPPQLLAEIAEFERRIRAGELQVPRGAF